MNITEKCYPRQLSTGRDSNRASPQYKSVALPLERTGPYKNHRFTGLSILMSIQAQERAVGSCEHSVTDFRVP
jgi:hypothetical protein